MTTENTSKKWSDETVASLRTFVGSVSPVSANTVNEAAAAFGVSARSIASKLRQLDFVVASMAVAKDPKFSSDQSMALRQLVEANAGVYTYKELAEVFQDGSFSPKQVQGKVLALELTGMIKAADKVAAIREYSDAQEATFVKMATSGAFIEDIAEALGKSIASIRGKALSLTRNERITQIPAQKESHAKESNDPVDMLGAALVTMTVAEIADATSKTERGVKTLLTRRGISVADYDGAGKAAKALAKAA